MNRTKVLFVGILTLFLILTFQVTTSFANTIALATPANNSETNVAVVFTWQNILNTNITDTYSVQLCRDTACATVTADSVRLSGVYSGTFGIPFNDTFFWRVIADDIQGDTEHDTTTARAILFDTDVDNVSKTSPAAGVVNTISGLQALVWSALGDSVGLDSYAIEVSASDTFVPLSYSDTIDGTLLTVTTTSLANDTYYWRIRAIDNLANHGIFSDSIGFRIFGPSSDTVTSVTGVVTGSIPIDTTSPVQPNFVANRKVDTSLSTVSVGTAGSTLTINVPARNDSFVLYVSSNVETTVIKVQAPDTTAITFDSTNVPAGFARTDTGFKAFVSTILIVDFYDTAGTTKITNLSDPSSAQFIYILEYQLSPADVNLLVQAGGDTALLAIYTGTSLNGTYTQASALTHVGLVSGRHIFRSGVLGVASPKVIGLLGSSGTSSGCVITSIFDSHGKLSNGLRTIRDAMLSTKAGRIFTEYYYARYK